mmetsp:Transcript_92172/g.177714  ORF Transcript_92172/g.177714 Transcript_92172/m.177714 type:complete len:157 (+) Transcript_92172:348-818(+)
MAAGSDRAETVVSVQSGVKPDTQAKGTAAATLAKANRVASSQAIPEWRVRTAEAPSADTTPDKEEAINGAPASSSDHSFSNFKSKHVTLLASASQSSMMSLSNLAIMCSVCWRLTLHGLINARHRNDETRPDREIPPTHETSTAKTNRHNTTEDGS